MMKTMSLTAVIVLAGAAATATADLRVVHASPDAPNVDVFVNGTPGVDDPAIVNLAFTAGTPYIPLPTDTYNFQVTPTGATDPVVIDVTTPIDGDTFYTVAASNFLADIEPLIFVDDNTLDPDNARIRFIHLSPDAPTVDIYAAPFTPGDMPLFDAVSFTESGGYITVPGGSYDLEVRVDADDALALEVPGLMVEAGSVYTVFAMGSLNAGTLQAVPFVDAVIPAPGTAAMLGLAGLTLARRRR